MRLVLFTFISGLICLLVGLCIGIWSGPKLRLSAPVKAIDSLIAKVRGVKTETDKNSPYEMYDYPTIKWKPKPVAEIPGAIVQLWTTFEPSSQSNQAPNGTENQAGRPAPGKMSYRLTVFKAPAKNQFEVQLLNEMGFKLMQFNAEDFHQVPGTQDITEARDSQPCTEEEYRKISEYSIK